MDSRANWTGKLGAVSCAGAVLAGLIYAGLVSSKDAHPIWIVALFGLAAFGLLSGLAGLISSRGRGRASIPSIVGLVLSLPLAYVGLMLVLALRDAETVSEPASPADAAARQAYFQSLVKLGAIGPCNALFPERAASFRQSHAAWLRENSQLIASGEESVRAATGPDFDKQPFALLAAEKQFTALLADLPAEKRLPWCEQYF